MLIYPSVKPSQLSVRSPTWPFKKSDEWSNIRQRVSSGKEVRLALWTVPLWHWEIDYNYLYDDITNLGTNTFTDFRTVMGFHLQTQGIASAFLFDDPTDDTVLDTARVQFGTGDGTTRAFQLVSNFGGFLMPVQAPAGVTSAPIFSGGAAPKVYINGALQASGYTIGDVGFGGGVVTFTSPPGAAAVLAWSGNYYYPATFEEDKLDPEEFMPMHGGGPLWALKGVKIVSVKY